MSPRWAFGCGEKVGDRRKSEVLTGSRCAFQKGHSGFWVVTQLTTDKVEVVGYFDGLGSWPGSKRETGGQLP